MKKSKGYTIIELLSVLTVCIFIFLALCGYGANIYKLASCDFKSPYKAEAIRGAGIFMAPVGVILGYIDIQDK